MSCCWHWSVSITGDDMRCSSCGNDAYNGYFEDRTRDMIFICKDCLLTYLKYLNSQKYDHKQIYDWHIKGYSNHEIARHLGTNILVVARAIKEQEKLL